MKRKICVFIGSRANYSSLKTILGALNNHNNIELQIVAGASAVLTRFGRVVELVQEDGYTVNHQFFSLVEGENPATMAQSTGMTTIQMVTALENLKPDFLLVVGDRFEIMAVVTAATYMNIRVAHTMGGEISGTIDESIRHAVTKFAHIHFPANDDAAQRIIRMGEDPQFVFNVGCPRNDLVAEELQTNSSIILKTLYDKYGGVGGLFSLDDPFLLVSQHPVTSEYGQNRKQFEETLKALNALKIPTIMLWPNVDAGGDEISKAIRTFRENENPNWLHLFKNLPTQLYIHLMNKTSCLIGNSSSGIREGAFIGTPVVNIGSRQDRRMRGKNVIDTPYKSGDIIKSIQKQLNHGHYKSEALYGDGKAGEKIADVLSDCVVPLQKTIQY